MMDFERTERLVAIVGRKFILAVFRCSCDRDLAGGLQSKRRQFGTTKFAREFAAYQGANLPWLKKK